MKRLNISILGVSETRLINQGKIKSDDSIKIYSGDKTHMRKIALIVHSPYKELISKYYVVSDKILFVKLEMKPFQTVIIYIYAPTADSIDEEIEQFYNSLNKTKKNMQSE